eukprot:3177133-Amphidinium_carterae.1
MQFARPLWCEAEINFIACTHWQPFCTAATGPGMDHASRAANRHVLRLKPTKQRFHLAPRWRRLPLHDGSDPVAKETLAIAWKVGTSQVSM